MSIVTIGDFKNYLQTVANAVSNGKMNVSDAEVEAALQTIAAAVANGKMAVQASDIEAILGEVSAAPTANTLADRLKQIADRLGEVSANPTTNTVLARLRALEGYLDGVEAALGAQADTEATGNGSLIAIVKRLRTILTDVWNDAANALNVQLTGSKANLKASQVIANAVALTDTTLQMVVVPNWNDYNRHALMVLNSHDQPVDIFIHSDLRGNWDNLYVGPSKTEQMVTIPASGRFFPILITDANLISLRGIQAANVRIAYRATTAPTSGSITIKLIMWAE